MARRDALDRKSKDRPRTLLLEDRSNGDIRSLYFWSISFRRCLCHWAAWEEVAMPVLEAGTPCVALIGNCDLLLDSSLSSSSLVSLPITLDGTSSVTLEDRKRTSRDEERQTEQYWRKFAGTVVVCGGGGAQWRRIGFLGGANP